MDTEKIHEYISALVDKETCGLSQEEIQFLEKAVHERPEYFGEYQLTIATKLCLLKHSNSTKCPAAIADSIKSYLYHIYKSKQASL